METDRQRGGSGTDRGRDRIREVGQAGERQRGNWDRWEEDREGEVGHAGAETDGEGEVGQRGERQREEVGQAEGGHTEREVGQTLGGQTERGSGTDGGDRQR